MKNREGKIRDYALIDESDKDLVINLKWSLSTNGRAVRSETINGKETSLYLHRRIAGVDDDKNLWVRFKNKDFLDCRVDNLKIIPVGNGEQNWKQINLYRTYGLEPGQYEKLLDKQDGKCAICGHIPQPELAKGKGPGKVPAMHRNLAVDHSHENDRVRGLLCFLCNIGLGSFRDNKEFLYSAIDYLQNR